MCCQGLAWLGVRKQGLTLNGVPPTIAFSVRQEGDYELPFAQKNA